MLTKEEIEKALQDVDNEMRQAVKDSQLLRLIELQAAKIALLGLLVEKRVA